MGRVTRQSKVIDESVSLPVFLVLWLVCAIVAGLIWQNLVANTPGDTLSITVPGMIVLSATFGLPGAGLICLALSVLRDP